MSDSSNVIYHVAECIYSQKGEQKLCTGIKECAWNTIIKMPLYYQIDSTNEHYCK